jgi:exonuclease VII large subunit
MEKIKAAARGLEQSVTFTVRDHERRITALTGQLVNRYRGLHLKSEEHIRSITALIRSRLHVLNQRELKQVEKAILKLDFEKRGRDNRKQQEELRQKSRFLFSQALKKLNHSQKDINAGCRLVQAGDPQQILKKGFTLVLDQENQVIKSLETFKEKESATLKFHDGSTGIKKNKEEK